MREERNQVAFLRWLARDHPELYGKALRVARNASAGLGRMGWIQAVVQAVAAVGSAVVQKKQIDKQVSLQKKALELSDAQAAAEREQAAKLALLEVNTKRAQAGLPPVDMTGAVIPSAALPNPSALAPFTPQGSTQFIPGVPNYVTGIGGALVVLVLLRATKVI